MGATSEDLKVIKDTMCEQLNKRFNGMDKKMDAICGKLDNLDRLLTGDDKYNIAGMKKEHDDMVEKFPEIERAVEKFWPIQEDYQGARWFVRNIKAIVVSIIVSLVVFVVWLFNLISGIQ